MMNSDPKTQARKWNAEDYAQNASAQRGWANELIEKLALQGHEALLDIGCGAGNVSIILDVIDRIILSGRWEAYFNDFIFPYFFPTVEHYEQWLSAAGYEAVRVQLIPKDMVHQAPDGLKGWLRSTWFPYTDRLPPHLRESFLSEIVSRYLERRPVDSAGRKHVEMVRLEVEARAK
jgi:trans-aconitate 2-methyltransferase